MTKARDLANGATALSAVSATELAFVDGVTSAIQTQMDAKIAKTLTTTTGDIIYASGANTPARLGIGSTDQVLTVAGGIPSWATPASGALTLISRQTFTSVATTGTTFDGVFTSTYKNYLVILENIFAGTSTDDLHLQLRVGAVTTASAYYGASQQLTPAAGGPITGTNNLAHMILATDMGLTGPRGSGTINFGLVGNASANAKFWGECIDKDGNFASFGGSQDAAAIYTGFLLKTASSNISGTVAVYGLATA